MTTEPTRPSQKNELYEMGQRSDLGRTRRVPSAYLVSIMVPSLAFLRDAPCLVGVRRKVAWCSLGESVEVVVVVVKVRQRTCAASPLLRGCSNAAVALFPNPTQLRHMPMAGVGIGCPIMQRCSVQHRPCTARAVSLGTGAVSGKRGAAGRVPGTTRRSLGGGKGGVSPGSSEAVRSRDTPRDQGRLETRTAHVALGCFISVLSPERE
jgi:hypothetical protein